MTEKQIEIINNLNENVEKLGNKDFDVYFYVLDTKNTPTGSLSYIYETALTLKNMGYRVTMLHNDNEFVGVREWMGDDYADIPHANIENENVEIKPCDFLFVPEIFSNVLAQTKKLPCKRVVILQNFNYLTEFMPFGGGWSDMGIKDVITTTERQAQLAKECFPYITTHIVPPAIKSLYYKGKEPQKMVVNIVAKNQSDVNRIVKPFYWKYPLYRWVSFRDLRGFPKEIYSKYLRESAITIWVDENTSFGYGALEAMKSGSIVIAKNTTLAQEWMETEDGVTLSPKKSAASDDPTNLAIEHEGGEEIPSDISEAVAKSIEKYTYENTSEKLLTYIDGIFDSRKNEMKSLITQINRFLCKPYFYTPF